MLIKLYNLVNEGIYGKVAIKLHTGEKHGPNIIPRDLVKALQATIPNSVIVETNTLYEGDRFTTAGHRETLKVNGWDFCPVDIMDEHGYVNLPVDNAFHLKEVAMGKNIVNYDSMLVLTHFKGHAMGGFGGSMKNIAIGCASGQEGKRQVHGVSGEPPADWGAWPAKEVLMENMADSAKAVIDHFGKRITYINVLRNMSVDCDCAGTAQQNRQLRISVFWLRQTFWRLIRLQLTLSTVRLQTIMILLRELKPDMACVSCLQWQNITWAIHSTNSLR